MIQSCRGPLLGVWLVCAAACLGACRHEGSASPSAGSSESPPSKSALAAQVVPGSTVAPDGFPTGQDSPEGVACDMARAFINTDGDLFRKVCYKRGNQTENYRKYNAFIDEKVSEMEQVKKMPKGAGGGPKNIGRVYKVRNLSRNGPASFGYAVLLLSGTKFVDVVCPMWNEPDFTTRTLVVQDEHTHVWYAIPRPDLFPLLSTGLNEESDSTELWAAPAH